MNTLTQLGSADRRVYRGAIGGWVRTLGVVELKAEDAMPSFTRYSVDVDRPRTLGADRQISCICCICWHMLLSSQGSQNLGGLRAYLFRLFASEDGKKKKRLWARIRIRSRSDISSRYSPDRPDRNQPQIRAAKRRFQPLIGSDEANGRSMRGK